jgi:hypothetical protein
MLQLTKGASHCFCFFGIEAESDCERANAGERASACSEISNKVCREDGFNHFYLHDS